MNMIGARACESPSVYFDESRSSLASQRYRRLFLFPVQLVLAWEYTQGRRVEKVSHMHCERKANPSQVGYVRPEGTEYACIHSTREPAVRHFALPKTSGRIVSQRTPALHQSTIALDLLSYSPRSTSHTTSSALDTTSVRLANTAPPHLS